MELIDALQIVCLTDPGQVRDHNEDSVASLPELGIVLLADGMGGYNAGEVASGMATSLIAAGLAQCWNAGALSKLDRDAAKALSQSLLQEQVKSANAAIYAAACLEISQPLHMSVIPGFIGCVMTFWNK